MAGRKRKSIHPHRISSMLILAHPEEDVLQLSQRLRVAREKGYDVGHSFLMSRDGIYSRNLVQFLDLMTVSGFIHDVPSCSPTENGRALLERQVIKGYLENKEVVEELADEFGFDLDEVIQRRYGELLRMN